jgi:hypothetical protein
LVTDLRVIKPVPIEQHLINNDLKVSEGISLIGQDGTLIQPLPPKDGEEVKPKPKGKNWTRS